MSTGMIPELMPTVGTVSSGWHVVSPRILTDVDVNTGLEMLRELHDGDMTGMTCIQQKILDQQHYGVRSCQHQIMKKDPEDASTVPNDRHVYGLFDHPTLLPLGGMTIIELPIEIPSNSIFCDP